jgi:RimJ/RimL family protein N-acetyltransferase
VPEPVVTLVDVNVDGADHVDLVAFLTSDRFPFHVLAELTAETVQQQIAQGAWDGPADGDGDHRTLWVVHGNDRVGVLRLDDVTDNAPLFDLRFGESVRGRGLGHKALRAATDLVFNDYPDIDRFEGQTREDNVAMRRVFEHNGWTKEAHYRRAWPVPGSEPVASIGYAILRSEWQTGQRIPLVWDDLPVPPAQSENDVR